MYYLLWCPEGEVQSKSAEVQVEGWLLVRKRNTETEIEHCIKECKKRKEFLRGRWMVIKGDAYDIKTQIQFLKQ